MRRGAEVVVVGAGVVGASVAFHLASRGCRDVLVLDRTEAGSGSTGRATGGFRAQFATDVNVRLSLMSRAKLIAFKDETGGDCGYRPCGYLFLARSEHLGTMRAALRVQHAAGLAESRELSLAEAREINPAASVDGIAGGFFCPSDGFIRPMGILQGYLDAARRLGVRVETGVEVTSVTAAGLETSRGAIDARHVVNATGAWAAGLAEIPVRPLKRQVAPTVPTDVLPDAMAMTIWLEDGFHLRVRDGRVLLLQPHATAESFDATFDESWLPGATRLAHARLPVLRSVAIDRAACWAGLYEMTPDKHAIVGRAGELWLANGSSGHGVMHSPALGQVVAELILDGKTSLDISALRPGRFAERAMNPVDSLL